MLKRRSPRRKVLISLAFAFVILLLAIVGVVVVAAYLTSRDKLPQKTYLADVDVSGLTVPEAIARTRQVLSGPVIMRYSDIAIPLQPAAVGFQVNEAAAQLVLDAVLRNQQGIDKLPDFLSNRVSIVRLRAPYQYSETGLENALLSVAGQYDHAPVPPQADPAQLTIIPGQDGRSLSLADARDLLLAALSTGLTRTVDLPLDITPVTADGMNALRSLLQARLANFVAAGNTAGVYIKDLKSGQELSVNGDVAFSGRGWLKIVTALEMLRITRDAPDQQLRNALASVVVDGNIANADAMLGTIGQGDENAGAMQINTMLKKAGLVDTFLAQAFGATTAPIAIITPANSRADATTSPDPKAQSTPADVGLLLESLDQCRANTGALILAFGGAFTPDKCQEILGLLARRNVGGLLQAASPGATVFSRQSWDDRTHADAALVQSTGGNYVVVVMLHGANPLQWADTSVLISDIGRAAYSFFNSGQLPPAVPPLTAPPPP